MLPGYTRLKTLLLNRVRRDDPYRRRRIWWLPTDSRVRTSSYPLISGDSFRHYCDHIFDETDAPFAPESVARGDTVFVNAHMLGAFFAHAHPRIGYPYVLVTHNSTYSSPGRWASHLEDPKIFAWFAQNADRRHPRLQPIPLGVANAHWKHGDVALIQQELQTIPPLSERPAGLAYMNFMRKRKGGGRAGVWEALHDAPFCHIAEKRPYREYLRDLKSHAFVISPPGNGLDCHRHWEALLMGAIPVMKRTTLDPLFEGLPVLLIDDWREVTEELLRSCHEQHRDETFDRGKLFLPYWFRLIEDTRASLRGPAAA